MAKRRMGVVATILAAESKCNELARAFYRAHGYQVPKGYDFRKAHHPQERLMWAMATMAHAFLIEGEELDDDEDAD